MTDDEDGGRGAVRDGLDRRTVNRGLAAAPVALAAACAGATTDPAPVAADRPPHHTASGFRNPPGSPTRGGSFGDWLGFFWRNFTREPPTAAVPPGHVLPEAEAVAGAARLNGADGLTWLGHASFLLRLGGLTVLTDPYLSAYASPLALLGPKRFAGPGIRATRLPPVDLLLMSHNHYDHLDLPSLDALPGRDRTTVVVPLGLRGYVEGRGFGRVHEVDWHDRVEVGGGRLAVTALPAIHFSKRTLFDANTTLWTGYAVEAAGGSGRRVYFAGDTAYGPVFERLGRSRTPFDLALVPIGAYEPRELMRATHTTPEEAVRLGRDLGARRLVGMHWGTIQLTDEPPFEPPERFRAAALAGGYAADDAWLMRIGETRALP